MRKGHVNQILLITDGCSNHGEDPLAIAALAKARDHSQCHWHYGREQTRS